MSLKQKDINVYFDLLEQLIRIPSFSKEEDGTAEVLDVFLRDAGHIVSRCHNNIIARAVKFDPNKPAVLLCSHHDTVKPNQGYTRDPFVPKVIDGKLFGLGSNDAGGPLIALLAAFDLLSDESLPVNLVYVAAGEEEITGAGGLSSVLDELPEIHLGIIGEPTGLKLAIAEKGLIVVDALTKGVAGHAAHHLDRHAIQIAAAEILKLRDFSFGKSSTLLGTTKATVSQIHAGEQHNQVPSECHYVIDVRVNERYSNEEVFKILKSVLTDSELKPRSFRLQSSAIPVDHPFVQLALQQGLQTYGSPTLSDQAVCPFPSVKLGPGDSSRSHMADEFIYLREIEEGIKTYLSLLTAYRPAS